MDLLAQLPDVLMDLWAYKHTTVHIRLGPVNLITTFLRSILKQVIANQNAYPLCLVVSFILRQYQGLILHLYFCYFLGYFVFTRNHLFLFSTVNMMILY